MSALDLYRSNRTAEAQAQLSRLGPGLAQLVDVTKHYRELANAEHERCMARVVQLEQRTSDLYQDEQKVKGAMDALDAADRRPVEKCTGRRGRGAAAK